MKRILGPMPGRDGKLSLRPSRLVCFCQALHRGGQRSTSSLLMWRSGLAAALVALSAVAGCGAAELPTARPEEVGMSSDILNAIKPAVQNAFVKRQIPGADIMVARHGKVIMDYTAGYDRPDYIYRLFSESKPITAVGVLILVDDGVIRLDDPVTKFLPEFKALRVIKNPELGTPIETVPLERPMLIRHLLTHTAGLTYGDSGNTTVDYMYRAANVLDLFTQDLDKFVEKLARIPLLDQPGTFWRYSVGFDVLGAVIQRASGMPFDEFMKRRVFEPLDMKDTGFHVPPEKAYLLVPFWTTAAVPGFLVPVPNSYSRTDFLKVPSLKSGGGGYCATTRDFFRFAQMLLNGGELDGVRILKKDTTEAMLSNQLPDALKPFSMPPVTFTYSDFGFGVSIQRVNRPGYSPVGEVTWGGAASTQWYIVPNLDTVIVYMTQVAPFTNVLAEIVKPAVYASIAGPDPSAKQQTMQTHVDVEPEGVVH